MEGTYLPSELACRLIELEVSMLDQQGLNRATILELLDCYTVHLLLLSEQYSSTMRKGTTEEISTINEKCRSSFKGQQSLKFFSKERKAI